MSSLPMNLPEKLAVECMNEDEFNNIVRIIRQVFPNKIIENLYEDLAKRFQSSFYVGYDIYGFEDVFSFDHITNQSLLRQYSYEIWSYEELLEFVSDGTRITKQECTCDVQVLLWGDGCKCGAIKPYECTGII